MPLDDFMIDALCEWRAETPYADRKDWIFASARKKGKQPLWPCGIMRNYIAKTAADVGITKKLGWAHVSQNVLHSTHRQRGRREDRAVIDAPRQSEHHSRAVCSSDRQ